MNVKRHFLSKKEVKRFKRELSTKYPEEFVNYLFSQEPVEICRSEIGTLYLFNRVPCLIEVKSGILVPTLIVVQKFAQQYPDVLPRVIVDLGAAKRIVNGADVMAPGIRGFEGEFNVGDLVVIVEEAKLKPIAIGEALTSRSEAENMSKGKVVKNLHHIGDRYWKIILKM